MSQTGPTIKLHNTFVYVELVASAKREREPWTFLLLAALLGLLLGGLLAD